MSVHAWRLALQCARQVNANAHCSCREKAGVDLEGDTIRLRTSYPDGLLSKLIQAASQELGMHVTS